MDIIILKELEAAYSEELNLFAGDLGALEAAVKTKMEQLGQESDIFSFKEFHLVYSSVMNTKSYINLMQFIPLVTFFLSWKTPQFSGDIVVE